MPKPEPFYAEAVPPKLQEFRWSNGRLAKSFDPARALSAPETDVVRTVFEGLTEIDVKSLKEMPAAAEKWSSSPDFRVWTFDIRKDARWSNGKRVTADDFVISWKRLVDLGDKTAHRDLFSNILGMQNPKPGTETPGVDSVDFGHQPSPVDSHAHPEPINSNSALRYQISHPSEAAPGATPEPSHEERKDKTATGQVAEKFGVEAISDTSLQVSLRAPDKDFPKLVANPIFRPIYGDGLEFESDPLDSDLVTNGAFKVASVGKDGIVLDRSETYWNKAAVKLERVRFVPKESAEAALAAYKKGEIDAVTNIDFEPLALKLLAPYEDFRQTTHSAINLYEVNAKVAPFSDRRVREALAISIDRERLTDRDLEGATQPATSFVPLGGKKSNGLFLDVDRAKQLLENAGYPNGAGFPKIRLVVNRNDTQQRVAKAVARMWKQNLNLDTDIVVKDSAELEIARTAGDFDLIRRGIVLPTIDEAVSLAAIFGDSRKSSEKKPEAPYVEPSRLGQPTPTPVQQRSAENGPSAEAPEPLEEGSVTEPVRDTSFSEQNAIYDLLAIPLYFPTSYSLVKPYVKGFETNGLDSPLLKEITIDSDWKPKPASREP